MRLTKFLEKRNKYKSQVLKRRFDRKHIGLAEFDILTITNLVDIVKRVNLMMMEDQMHDLKERFKKKK